MRPILAMCLALLPLACTTGSHAGPRGSDAAEVRALWVARTAYRSPEDVRAILRNAAEHHFNVVLWQVRGNATVYYPSKYEPWAFELSGELEGLGKDPGWDPLQLACDEAHGRGLELHAWVNVFPAWKRTTPPPPNAPQLWNTHRDWFMQNRRGETMWPQGWWDYWYAFVDPGVPEVREHLHDVFLEIVEGYPVDGLHFDYIRYPNEVGDWSFHPTSVARFRQHYKDTLDVSPETYPVQWSEWKRAQITELVHAVYRDVKEAKPDVLVSAAVLNDWPRGHNDYGQDARTWLARGILDATLPMLYRFEPDDFRPLARDHLLHAYGRWVLPGLSAGRSSAEDLVELIEIGRALGAPGVAVFGYGALFRQHVPGEKARALRAGPFRARVSVPHRVPVRG